MRTHGKKNRGPIVFSFLLLLLLIEPLTASAYIDPGSGGFLIQMLIASLVGASVAVRTFWGSIRLLFARKKDISARPDESKIIQDKT